jgi:hypothetical protein
LSAREEEEERYAKKEKKKIHGPACMNATKGFAM